MSQNRVSVQGIITSRESKAPVAGAEVRVGAKNENEMVGYAPTSTDECGRFAVELTWEGPDVADLVIDTRAVGYGTSLWPWMAIQPLDAAREAGTIRDGDERVAHIELPPGFALDVLVEDENGAPLPGAASVVLCTSAEAGYCYWPLHYHVHGPEGCYPKANSDGHLLWMGFGELQPGERYVVSVQHGDFAEYLMQSPELLPRENGVATATVRMSRGVQLTGTVTDRAGTLLENARVNAVLTDTSGAVPRCHQVSRTIYSDGDGRYLFTSLNPGRYVITVSRDDIGQSVISDVEVPAARGSFDVFLLEGAAVSGTLLGKDGAPLAGVTVTASWVKPNYGRRSTTTDEKGTFTIRGLPPRHGYMVEAHSPDRMRFYGFARLRGTKHGVFFDERKLAKVSGRLIDPITSEPVTGPVHATAWSPAPIQFMGMVIGTENDGSFEIVVPAATCSITLQAQNRLYALVDIDLEPGQIWHKEVQGLPGVNVLVRVRDDATSQPLSNAQVQVNLHGVWRSGSHLQTDANGETLHPNLPPFKASVRVVSPGYEMVTLPPCRLGSRHGRDITVSLKKKE